MPGILVSFARSAARLFRRDPGLRRTGAGLATIASSRRRSLNSSSRSKSSICSRKRLPHWEYSHLGGSGPEAEAWQVDLVEREDALRQLKPAMHQPGVRDVLADAEVAGGAHQEGRIDRIHPSSAENPDRLGHGRLGRLVKGGAARHHGHGFI